MKQALALAGVGPRRETCASTKARRGGLAVQ